MNDIFDIVEYNQINGTHKWTINTTKSNLIGFAKSENLEKEVDNWDIHKAFCEEYGFMFMYPEDYVSIYTLLSLSKYSKIYCHPRDQNSHSTLEKFDLETKLIRWLYTEEIHYDQALNYETISCHFSKSGFQDYSEKIGILKILWDSLTKNIANSKLYELRNSYHIHQAVICGGNSQVFKCNNFIGINSEEQLTKTLKLLAGDKEPTLEQLLSNCQFFIADFKGEDLGYARQMNIYTKMELKSIMDDLLGNFSHFQNDLRSLNKNVKNLKEYQAKLSILETKYGR